MKILIDGIERDWSYDEDQILGDAIRDINERLLLNDHRVVVGIKIDDSALPEDIKKLTPDQVTVDRIGQISFDTQLFQENLAEELDKGGMMLQQVRDSVSDIVGHMLSEEIDVAMNLLKESIDKLLWSFNLLIQASGIGAVDFGNVACGDGSLKDFMGRFNSTLQELMQAMENNDATLINDFLEYEIEPAIGELKAVIPAVRDLVAEFKFKD
jgi:hypothetical protein